MRSNHNIVLTEDGLLLKRRAQEMLSLAEKTKRDFLQKETELTGEIAVGSGEFLSYPNWWYGVPMALLSFLDNNDLSGKQVYLFCSHGTGALASSVEIITEALPDANISDNVFDCYEEDAAGSREEIESWLAELGY